MDEGLLQTEFARVVNDSKLKAPTRRHSAISALLSVPVSPPPPLAAPLPASSAAPMPSYSDKQQGHIDRLSPLSPPTSPVSSGRASSSLAVHSATPCQPSSLPAMVLPKLAPPQSLMGFDNTSFEPTLSSVLSPVSPTNHSQYHSIAAGVPSSAPVRTPPVLPPRLDMQLSPSPSKHAALEIQPITPPAWTPSGGPTNVAPSTPPALLGNTVVAPSSATHTPSSRRRTAPYAGVAAMATVSAPHPLNILADISSHVPKSPLQSPSKEHLASARLASFIPPRKTICKTDPHSTVTSHPGSVSKRKAPSRPTSEPSPRVTGNTKSSKETSATGKRSFECSLCSRSFSERFNLNKHIRAVHERRRPFECTTCHARFQQRDHMQKHEMCVHKKLRQFACDTCGAAFGWRGVLKKHRKSVHGLPS